MGWGGMAGRGGMVTVGGEKGEGEVLEQAKVTVE